MVASSEQVTNFASVGENLRASEPEPEPKNQKVREARRRANELQVARNPDNTILPTTTTARGLCLPQVG